MISCVDDFLYLMVDMGILLLLDTNYFIEVLMNFLSDSSVSQLFQPTVTALSLFT